MRYVTVRIRNMVSNSCIHLVQMVLQQAGFAVQTVRLGEVCFVVNDHFSRTNVLRAIEKYGFSLLDDKELQVVEEIKIAVIELVHFDGYKNSIIRNSDYLVDKLGISYQYLSALFSKYEGITLEKYIILHKIEKVKELISYQELTLSEIAFMMGYSSVQYLSTQFKQITGLSVTDYKKNGLFTRIPLDELNKVVEKSYIKD